MNYFDKQEKRNLKLLNEMNEQLGWFETISGTVRFSSTDAKATDKKGRLIHMELKERNLTINDAAKLQDILIEPCKIYNFSQIMESGYTRDEVPLYINFLNDGIVIFNLNEIDSMSYYPNHRQRNFGKQKTEFETRLGLRMKDAIIFRKTENGKMLRIQ